MDADHRHTLALGTHLFGFAHGYVKFRNKKTTYRLTQNPEITGLSGGFKILKKLVLDLGREMVKKKQYFFVLIWVFF
jgi:hypothetical protein